MSIQDQLRKLTKNEITVLYWKCKGLKYVQIGKKLDYSVDWVTLTMGGAYTKLGFSKDMHWTKRWEILKSEVCPRLPKNIDDWQPVIEITEGITEEIREEPVNPDIKALVLYDEQMIEAEKEKSLLPPKPQEPIIIKTNGKKSPKPSCLSRIILAVFFIVVIAGVGYAAYMFGRGATPVPQIVVVTATLPPATETPLPTVTPEFTNTPVPTLTFTPEPTFTPLPTETPKGYYDQGEDVLLKEGVYAFLSEKFRVAGQVFCMKPDNGFGVTIFFKNTTNDQFNLRFDADSFHAVDDLGNKYPLIGSGVWYCEGNHGIQEDVVTSYGSEIFISITFRGVPPLDAKYIFITADQISGVGPITFRKSIY